jgi:putative ABC transport system ATP-binding protein
MSEVGEGGDVVERSEVVVEIRNVTKMFSHGDTQLAALDGANLEIAAGEFFCLMGPSGSGKSTLLNLIAGIDKPSSGTVTVLGADVAHMSEDELGAWRNQHLGFVFQQFNLIPVLTAFENVELPLLLTRLSKAQRRQHAESALRLVGLADRMDHYPRQLSGGQEQRAAIARALVMDPVLILADEPTGDLDAKSAEEVLAVMVRLNRDFGKTFVMVTHDPRAAAHASVVRHLEKGKLLAADAVGDDLPAASSASR